MGVRKSKVAGAAKALGQHRLHQQYKKVVPLMVRIIVFAVLASHYRKLTCPLSKRKMSFS